MNKIEKYYNYIVSDLLKKTIVEDDPIWVYSIKFPWEQLTIGTDFITLNFIMDELDSGVVYKYLESQYGTTVDDGLSVIVKYGMSLEKKYE